MMFGWEEVEPQLFQALVSFTIILLSTFLVSDTIYRIAFFNNLPYWTTLSSIDKVLKAVSGTNLKVIILAFI